MSCKADFMTLASLKPKTYDKYKDRVEEAKKKFPNAPRKELLKYLIGEDALSGNIKTEAKTTKKPGGAERGKLPGARSDSKGSGRLSDAEKRAKRLENVRI